MKTIADPKPPFVEVYGTHDIGEQAFVRSLLGSYGIRTMEPNFNAERMAVWTSSFVRHFTVFVAPQDAATARRLIKVYLRKQAGKPPPEALVLLCRASLALAAAIVLAQAIEIVLALSRR